MEVFVYFGTLQMVAMLKLGKRESYRDGSVEVHNRGSLSCQITVQKN